MNPNCDSTIQAIINKQWTSIIIVSHAITPEFQNPRLLEGLLLLYCWLLIVRIDYKVEEEKNRMEHSGESNPSHNGSPLPSDNPFTQFYSQLLHQGMR